jgi:hypothetical protein
MTSPSMPVRTSRSSLLGIIVTSTNRTSPPAGVQARPVATPGGGALGHLVEEARAAEVLHEVVGVIADGLALPSASRRATFAATVAISRSRLRTPASRVYPRTIWRMASGSNDSSSGDRPWAASCFGIRYCLAIPTFSSSVYPDSGRISIRSRSGTGIVSRVLAVAMNSTCDRSKGTPR